MKKYRCLKCIRHSHGWNNVTRDECGFCNWYEIDIGFIYNDGLFNPENCKMFKEK